jgi:hypothetical protein
MHNVKRNTPAWSIPTNNFEQGFNIYVQVLEFTPCLELMNSQTLWKCYQKYTNLIWDM